MQKDIMEEESLQATPEDNDDMAQEPFDPQSVNISRRTPTIDLLIFRLREDELDLFPDFRPQMGIWDDGAQSRLIESLLIRIPIPAFYFDATDENKWLVIDGVQRLTALARFVMNEQELEKLRLKKLKLCDLEFLTNLNGKTFGELDRRLQRCIEVTQVPLYIIEPGTPPAVKYNIFKRFHTDSLRYNHFLKQR